MPKIVILDGHTENPGDLSWGGFEALGELTVYDRTAPGDIASRIGDAEIAFTNKAPLPRGVIFACPNLKFIGVLATGYNVVDVAAAKEKGVLVANIPAYSTPSVAQLVFARSATTPSATATRCTRGAGRTAPTSASGMLR